MNNKSLRKDWKCKLKDTTILMLPNFKETNDQTANIKK